MAWIEIHQTLPKHKKTLATAGRLSVGRHTIVGHLIELWTWALDNVPSDGFMGNISDLEIATAADWRGDEHDFVNALIYAGFIDENPDGRWIHDWYDYAGKLLDKREKEKERSKNRRATKKEPTDDQRSTDGQPENNREKLRGTVTFTVPKDLKNATAVGANAGVREGHTDDQGKNSGEVPILSREELREKDRVPFSTEVPSSTHEDIQDSNRVPSLETNESTVVLSSERVTILPERVLPLDGESPSQAGAESQTTGDMLLNSEAPELVHEDFLQIENLAVSLLQRPVIRPDEYQMLKNLVASGVSISTIMQGMREAFDHYQPRRPRDKINSLTYCENHILDLHEKLTCVPTPIETGRSNSTHGSRQYHRPDVERANREAGRGGQGSEYEWLFEGQQ